MALIECCLSNICANGREAIRRSDHRIRRSSCLERCGRCRDRPFLVVDGEVREGDSYRELLDAVEVDAEVREG